MNHRNGGLTVFLLSIFLVSTIPHVNADLSTTNNTLFLACSGQNDCSLSQDAAGDTMISGEERSATILSPVTVTLEFSMRPDQVSVSLIPIELDTLEIDLRIQEDSMGTSRPDIQAELILGPSVNEWTMSAPEFQPGEQAATYRLENAELELSQGRILKPSQEVLLKISFEINQPVTWELYLNGNSWFELPIEWSIDSNAANIDEPTSFSQPRNINLIEEQTQGGLMGDDVDCYRFNVNEDVSALTVSIEWDTAPIEVEQNHAIPDLWDDEDRSESEPEVRTMYEGDIVVNEIRWSEPKSGMHTLCWFGEQNRYQSYQFSGRESLTGIGSTTPEEFEGEAIWNGGISHAGRIGETSSPKGAGMMTMIFAATGIIVALSGYILPLSSQWLPRFLLPISIILLILGGIISPAVSISNETPNPGEVSFDDVLKQRINRIYQGILMGDDSEYGPLWYGGFLGVSNGENLQMMLTIESFHPLGDGRWQIHSEELQEIDLDRLIFSKLNEGELTSENQVKFILRAGRLLSLDLLMLEALLVVENQPSGEIAHIDWTMTSAPGMGSNSAPAWTTRPDSITLDDWKKISEAVRPELLSVSFCDCGIDAMELSVLPSEIYVNDLITPGGIETSNGLIPYDFWVAMLGFVVLALSAYVEKIRRDDAKLLAEKML